MIQRKQTVFLIIALLFTVACLCMPVGTLSFDKMGSDAIVYNLWVAADAGKTLQYGLFLPSCCFRVRLTCSPYLCITIANCKASCAWLMRC